jgi:hypothetical protein
MRTLMVFACGLAVAVLLGGCFMHTYIGNGGRDKSPDGKYYLYMEVHGASRKPYVDNTKKTAYLSIWPTSGKPESPLFAGKHVFVGADVGTRVEWPNNEGLSIIFFDYGDKVLISDAVKAGAPSNYIAIVRLHRAAGSGKFVEQP